MLHSHHYVFPCKSPEFGNWVVQDHIHWGDARPESWKGALEIHVRELGFNKTQPDDRHSNANGEEILIYI
jgi:hypothetical protein